MAVDFGIPTLFDPKKLVLLSFFDGIGTAPFIISQMIGKPRMAFSWETDTECLNVSIHRVPWVMQRGDALLDNMESVAQIVMEGDPHKECFILITAGPPCPDYSVVKSQAEGRQGPEGSKFVGLCGKIEQLEGLLPDHQFGLVVENVVMADDSDTHFFSDRLKAQPVLVDAADRGAVSRPRLWWTRLDWTVNRTNPFTQEPLTWVQQNQHRKLRMDIGRLDLSQLDFRGYQLHPDVLSGSKKVPCFTTPAPDDAGRPEPARSRGKVDPETKQRWLQGNRQYAPWQYSPQAMAQKDGQMHVMPIHRAAS
eukprot:s392_g32.t1